MALLGAKAKTIQRVKAEHPEWDDNTIVSKLVAYSSSEFNVAWVLSRLGLKSMNLVLDS